MPVSAIGGDWEAARQICELWARTWAKDTGLEIFGVKPLSGSSTQANSGYAGVTFDVVVGIGVISLNQNQPGAMDNWKWSARVDAWRRLFTGKDGRQGKILTRREDGMASVTAIHRVRLPNGLHIDSPPISGIPYGVSPLVPGRMADDEPLPPWAGGPSAWHADDDA